MCELALARRKPTHVARRWLSNFAIGAIDSAALRWVLPLGSLALALGAAESQRGVLHAIAAPPLASFLITVLALDAIAYATHRLVHAVPLLWRFHRVHHADLELDFSTSQRHHPVDVLVTTALRLAGVAALGASPAGVVAYSLLRGPIDAFSHGNLELPARLDRSIRWLFITPAMHAVHHSAARTETDANFATLFSLWDRWFATYREAPARGYPEMTIGIEGFRTPRDLDLDQLLVQPFRRERGAAPEAA